MRGSFDEALATVAPIVADVRERGDEALLEWTSRFDGPRPSGIRVPAERLDAAQVDDDVLDALRRMIKAVRRFSEAQRPADTSVEAAPGIVSERRWLPLGAVGVCVPSGRQPLPSSLVMTAVPALVAGVGRVAVVTPNPADATLVVARELGIDEVYAVGGAQAVAALAYGTATVPPVHAIVGPGNAYVTAAKLLVASSALSVRSSASLSSPCSAWASRSAATESAAAESSAITTTSLGPAGRSMRTRLATRSLAAVT